MKGANLQAATAAIGQQGFGALLHFTRGFVGEGDGGNVLCFEAAFVDQPTYFASDYTGLATTCAGQYQERTIDCAHCFFLRWI